jgi:hypothetical protein
MDPTNDFVLMATTSLEKTVKTVPKKLVTVEICGHPEPHLWTH